MCLCKLEKMSFWINSSENIFFRSIKRTEKDENNERPARGSQHTCIAFLLQHLSPLPDLRPSLIKSSIQHFDVIISLQQSLQALHLVPNVDNLENSIASSCLSPRLSRQYLRPSLTNGSGIFRPFAAAACIPLNLALCVHCPKTGCVSTPQARTSPQPHGRPSVLPHQKHCCIVVI